MNRYVRVLITLIGFLLIAINAQALSVEEIIVLKNAGVKEKTISVIDSSNAIYRAIFSIDEILGLKAAGFSDEFILNKIRTAGATVPETEEDAAHDRKLRRLKSQLAVSAEYLTSLINNPEIIKLVKSGKLPGADYAEIVKYLKNYAQSAQANLDKTKAKNRKQPRPASDTQPAAVPPGVVIYHDKTE